MVGNGGDIAVQSPGAGVVDAARRSDVEVIASSFENLALVVESSIQNAVVAGAGDVEGGGTGDGKTTGAADGAASPVHGASNADGSGAGHPAIAAQRKTRNRGRSVEGHGSGTDAQTSGKCRSPTDRQRTAGERNRRARI